MRSRDSKESKRIARQKRVRATVKGTSSRPRLCVFKSLTNKELTLDSKITSNKYYKYGAYLETESLRLVDNIKKVTKVTSVKKKGDNYIAEYEAITDQNNTLNGKVTLLKENEKYYVISNEINTSNHIN